MGQQSNFSGWNYADIIEAIEPVIPEDTPALIHGDHVTSWGELRQRTNRLAHHFIDEGFKPDEKIAFYLRNRPEYMEGVVAGLKARLVHVNVNYRYNAEEVNYILANSDSRILVFGREFSPIVEDIKTKPNDIDLWICVEDGSGCDVPSFAVSFDELANSGNASGVNIERSPDDVFLMYTGGTTGMPKGVIWPQHDLRSVLLGGQDLPRIPVDVEDHAALVSELGPGPSCFIACPLMHGTGIFTAISAMIMGGAVVTPPSKSFNAFEMWEIIDRYRVPTMIIVGDAFARPMVKVLEENPGKFDLSCVVAMGSSGVMWSLEMKQAILRHLPQCALIDSYGSSEGMGLGSSVTTKGADNATAKFIIGDGVKVFNETTWKEVVPGSGEVGLIARGRPISAGYYKDPEKTAKTFKIIDGERYSVPGDYCTVEADGSITLLGRGSGCINTGGEKVFPEEVEEALKLHDLISDALVVGVADERWGHIVTAVVELPDPAALNEAALKDHVRGQLAGYKVPKHIVATQQMFRAPNGKADYKSARAFVESAIR